MKTGTEKTKANRSVVKWLVVGLVAGGLGGAGAMIAEIARLGVVRDLAGIYCMIAFCAGIVLAVGALFVVIRGGNVGRLDAVRVLSLGAALAVSTAVPYAVAMHLMLDCAELQGQGGTIVAALEAYRGQTGRYPQSLSDVIDAPDTRHGPWRYHVGAGGFTLTVGEFGRDGRRVRYASESRTWDCDSDSD